MSKVRTGVIGVGHLGYHHARIYSALEQTNLVGIVDVDGENAHKASSDFDVPAFDNVEALIKSGVDAVSLAVPTTLHFELSMQLLEAGIDVLVEKPIAVETEQAEKMVEKASELERILQVGHIERFNGAVIALFEAISKPQFIECHRLSPYPNRGDDVSAVLDLMIHDLDIILALDGTEAVSVEAMGVPVFSKYEDIANARITFKSGCVANITCSRISLDKMRKIRVFAHDTYVSTDYSAKQVIAYKKKPGELKDGMSPMELISIETLDVKDDEPLKLELESFLECVSQRKRPLVAGEDGLAALKLAQQVTDIMRGHL